MNDTAPLSMPSLLEHAAWVNQLAHRLVTDPELARDVAQEAWRSALERPPGDTRNLKAWWSRVVHHSVLRLRRAELRREAREARVPTAGPEDSTAELVERAELQRDLVDRVLALSPPLREALLLRFFEHLPPRDIAHRLDVPVNTVRTRLQRGLVQLRQQLEREHPGRGAWALALLPLARAHAAHPEAAVALAHGARAEGVIASATGVGTGLSGGLLLAGAAVLLSALGLGAWWGLESSAEPESPRIETATAPPPRRCAPCCSTPMGTPCPACDGARTSRPSCAAPTTPDDWSSPPRPSAPSSSRSPAGCCWAVEPRCARSTTSSCTWWRNARAR